MHWHEGDVVRKLRESVQWTLDDLSRASGVSVQVINRLEKGRTRDPKTATLGRLAKAFHRNWTANHLRNAVPNPYMLVVRPASRPRAKKRPPARAQAVRTKRKRA